ncbi:hypothetical protein GGF31_005333 [Allomyces arbusculus]|nr:hypothetical protein GGF31_005333 [Allomyces arbusculus]
MSAAATTIANAAAAATSGNRKANIAIIIYSLYHHIYDLATHVKKGVDASGRATATIYRVPETLPAEVLQKMHAPAAPPVPEATVDHLAASDGVIFGVPTRFGTAPAQIKGFLDATGRLWVSGGMMGKPAGVFTCTNSQHGGQETTIMTMVPYFAHLGMVYVPLGYASPHINQVGEVLGGSPWGASAIAGPDGSRKVSEKEGEIAEVQGRRFAEVAAKLMPENVVPPGMAGVETQTA